MKICLNTFLFLLLFLDNSFAQDLAGSSYFTITEASKEDFHKAKKKYKNIPFENATKIKSDSTGMSLSLSGGGKVRLERNTNAEYKMSDLPDSYEYKGYWPQIRQHVIRQIFYGYEEYLLISDPRGDREVLWGGNLPLASPDKKKIACFAYWTVGRLPNGIQVFEVKNYSSEYYIVKILEINQKIWYPYDIVWESNSSLLIEVSNFELAKQELNTPKYYLRILFK